MGLRSGAEYVESLKKRKPTIYCLGEKVDDVLEHPVLRSTIATVARTFDLAKNPEYEDLLTVESPFLEGERVNRFLQPFFTVDHLVKRQHQIRFLQRRLGSCALRCTGLGMVNSLWETTYQIDKAKGTHYLGRLEDWLKYIQKYDIYETGCMMDVKGHRGLRPSKQPDPDMYLHIVERRPNGIVVRGAKASQSGPAISNETAVIPSVYGHDEADEPYAVAFAVPTDEKGITYIMQHNTADAIAYTGDDRDLGNPRYGGGFGSTSLMIFDDVFIPNERVFMAGEWEFSATIVRAMGLMARMWQCGCRPALMELLTGAAAFAAQANGVANAAHIRSKLNDMTIHSQTAWGLALSAAYQGKPSPSGSGIVLPDSLTINVGKYRSVEGYWECCKLANDIAGGLATTVPSFKDYDNPETHGWMEKYLRANPDVPTEHRMRIMRLIQCMVEGPMAGGIHQSGGPLENQKIIVERDGEYQEKIHDAKVLCGILPEED